MRLSEKTLEINFCSQFAAAWVGSVTWFGLTQAQEARRGYDVATRLQGRLFLFQLKASNTVVRGGYRRFSLPHTQYQVLSGLTRRYRIRRSVFYALPLVGTTLELASSGGAVLSQTELIDVSGIPPLAAPTKSWGGVRRSGLHYAYLKPPDATIESEPVTVTSTSASELVEGLRQAPASDGMSAECLLDIATEIAQRPRAEWLRAGRLFGAVVGTPPAMG